MEAHIDETRALLRGLAIQVEHTAARVLEESEEGILHHTGLSAREYEAMLLLAQGLNTREVAELMSISTSTIRTHRKRIYEKMGFTNNADLVRYVTEHRLLR